MKIDIKKRIEEARERCKSGLKSKRAYRRKKPTVFKRKKVGPFDLESVCGKAWVLCADVPADEQGIVYFVESGGYIKIGYTQGSAKQRIRDFEVGSPLDFQILTTIRGNKKLERGLHEVFSEQRFRGEWFNPGGPLMEFIEAVRECPVAPKVKRRIRGSVFGFDFKEIERTSLLSELNATA